jgi:iron-sulfur cluster repair protein YtfE (RIC family)
MNARPHAQDFPSAEPAGLEQVAMLWAAHANLRADLDAIRRTLDGLSEATVTPSDAHAAIAGLGIASHDWQLGAWCDRYCHVVTTHHDIEDSRIFPTLSRLFPELVDTLEQLKEDHVKLARLLQRAQRSLAVHPIDVGTSRTALTELADHLEAHLTREEDAIFPALAQLTAWV